MPFVFFGVGELAESLACQARGARCLHLAPVGGSNPSPEAKI